MPLSRRNSEKNKIFTSTSPHLCTIWITGYKNVSQHKYMSTRGVLNMSLQFFSLFIHMNRNNVLCYVFFYVEPRVRIRFAFTLNECAREICLQTRCVREGRGARIDDVDKTKPCMQHVILGHSSMFMTVFGFSTRRVHTISSHAFPASSYDLEARRGSHARHHGGHGHGSLQRSGGAQHYQGQTRDYTIVCSFQLAHAITKQLT